MSATIEDQALWLKMEAVANRYSLCQKTIQRLSRSGQFTRGRKFGRALRFRLSDLERFDNDGGLTVSLSKEVA